MPERRYSETPFYDFDKNYGDAVDLIRKVFGDERADAVAAAKGKNTRTDFMTAITWGWFYHRPIVSPLHRAWVLIGNSFAQKNYDALRDHAQWAMAEGAHREKILDALFTFSVYGGIPNVNQATEVIEGLFAELDAKGWKPYTPTTPLPDTVDHNYYDFEENYTAGVDISFRRNYGPGSGGDRAERLARMGQSAIGDFQAIHWGWIMHRAFLEPLERALVIFGSDTANKGYLALKDHVQYAMVEGFTREQVQEVMMMLNLFNGWPANRQAGTAITELFQELDEAEKAVKR